jgi:predicted nucleotide-binding protein
MSAKDKPKRDVRIFLSYASEDKNRAAELTSQLAQRPNLHVFSADKMSAGENWQSKIKKELSASDFFVILLSPTSMQSKWVQFELGAAWGLNKFIIPVVTSHDLLNKIPVDLAGLHVIEMEHLKKADAISEIMDLYEKAAA